MTRNELNTQYFEWMYKLVTGERLRGRVYINTIPRTSNIKSSYEKLLTYLNDIPFRYSLQRDDNRESDGIDLRYRFGYELSYPDSLIGNLLDDHPCSVLEMMVALALRCEEDIMNDPSKGDRTKLWFWEMISNMGLGEMSDWNFDREYVRDCVNRMLDREYDPDGTGGLFIIKKKKRDLRTVEIWYQACWYLNELLEKGV